MNAFTWPFEQHGSVFFLLFSALIVSAIAGAEVKINGEVWQVSILTPSNLDAWKGDLLKAENFSSRKEFEKSRRIVEKIQRKLGTNSVSLLNGDDARLTLASWHLYLTSRIPNSVACFDSEAYALERDFSEMAKGRKLWAYKEMYRIAMDYHYRRGDYKLHDVAAAKLAIYDLEDELRTCNLITCYLERPWNFKEAGLQLAIEDCPGSNMASASVGLLKILCLDSDETKFGESLKWLDSHPDESQALVSSCLKIASLNFSESCETLDLYGNALVKLAERQTNDAERIPVCAMALNELNKLKSVEKWLPKDR